MKRSIEKGIEEHRETMSSIDLCNENHIERAIKIALKDFADKIEKRIELRIKYLKEEIPHLSKDIVFEIYARINELKVRKKQIEELKKQEGIE